MRGMRTSSAIELFVPLAREDEQPLHHQLEQQLREAVRSGRLVPDTTLPSSRALAGQLGVARGVVVESYEQLVAEGYLVTRPGGSTRVARVPMHPARLPATPETTHIEHDFRPGKPDVAEFPRAAWLRSVRRVLETAPADRFDYPDGRGIPELREVLSAYLDRVRGTCTSPADIIVSSGFAQGIGLLGQALRETGARRVGVEDPWNPKYRRALAAAGLEVVPIPVDDEGIRVDHLSHVRVDAVVVTPAHQYPTGAVLAPERRSALIDWADEHDGLIIEDDYDAEYRYDRAAVGALQGVAPERVIYVGSASKILAPALRLGWLLMPEPLLRSGIELKRRADNGSPVLEQLTYASFVAAGDLDRHLRRLRRVYRARREALLDALSTHCPDWTVLGAAAGLHLVAVPPPDVDIPHMIRRAAARSVRLYPLSNYASTGSARGLIFGYARLPERDIAEAVRRMVVPELERRSCVSE